MQTIREILGLNFLSLSFDDDDRKKYNANAEGKRIEEVIIDGVKITGYNAFSFVRKLTYVKSPTRSADGTIGNLDSYPVFTTPQLQIDFSLLGIDMYRKIMNLIYARREHLVQCYDIVRNTRVTEKMYFEPEELPKLATITRQLQGEASARIEILGVQDYVVTMVGTNMPNEIININYYDRNNNIIPNASVQMVENTEILIGEGVTVDDVNGQKFNNKWQRGYLDNGVWENIGEPYANKQAYSVVLESAEEIASKSISFKAVYKDSKDYNLVLNYGLGEPITDGYSKTVATIPFTAGQTYIQALEKNKYFKRLPITYVPQVEINGEKYDTHRRLGWFRTPTYGVGSVAITDYDEILPHSDTAIYQLFEPIKHTVNFEGEMFKALTLLSIDVPVNENVPLPKFTEYENSSGETWKFIGWYTNEERTTLFDGKMPPYNITLYGKWEKIK
jgi:hypothetical protein